MIAEIHNKISSTGSNLNDRREDQLTGDIFGALRYLSFEKGLLNLLLLAKGDDKEFIKSAVTSMNWQNTNIYFWKRYKDCEPDVMLVSDKTVVCIEVKYKSGISSDDGADYSHTIITQNENTEEPISTHQLKKESKILTSKFSNKKNKILLLVADELSCAEIYNDTENRMLLDNDKILFGYISWQDILISFEKNQNTVEFPSRQILIDIVKLLYKKEFDRFKNFLSVNKNINNKKTWIFNETEDSNFSFKTDLNIDRGLFYEY